jgi:hypothetical protein
MDCIKKKGEEIIEIKKLLEEMHAEKILYLQQGLLSKSLNEIYEYM